MIKQHITDNCKFYKPKNKEKYKGEYPVICRSGWEYQLCQWLDADVRILFWSSEPFAIQYFNPLTQRKARYYPDYIARTKTDKGKTVTWVIELKPFKETHPPLKRGKKKKSTLIYEEKTWKVNHAKWKAAEAFCKQKGWVFKIITEKQLFGKK